MADSRLHDGPSRSELKAKVAELEAQLAAANARAEAAEKRECAWCEAALKHYPPNWAFDATNPQLVITNIAEYRAAFGIGNKTVDAHDEAKADAAQSRNALTKVEEWFASESGPIYRLWEDTDICNYDNRECEWEEALAEVRDFNIPADCLGYGTEWPDVALYREILVALRPDEWSAAAPFVFDLVAHLTRQRAFSLKTFGPGVRTKGVIEHIKKELVEVEEAPDDVFEWIDIATLAFDGAWRAGFEPEQIAAALAAKLTKNEQKQWPDWRTCDPNKAIEHVRDEQPAESENPLCVCNHRLNTHNPCCVSACGCDSFISADKSLTDAYVDALMAADDEQHAESEGE